MTNTIESIPNRSEAMETAVGRYRKGNDQAMGFAFDGAPIGARVILEAASDDEVSVYVLPDGSEVAVNDNDGGWAVEITPAQSNSAMTLDEFQGRDDMHLAFGWVGIEERGGKFFTWHHGVQETLASIEDDTEDPPQDWSEEEHARCEALVAKVHSEGRKIWVL